MVKNLARKWRICLVVMVLGISACASFNAVDKPLSHWTPALDRRAKRQIVGERSPELLILLAFSGGGTRAAAFAYGVLQELAATEITTDDGPPAIIAGKLEDSLGGGICQVSTTLFNAVFFAGLDVTARTNHSIYISHYPKGRDATVSWGGPAFRFVNDTPNWILIKAASSRSSLTFVLYGTPQNRQVTYTTGDWYGLKPPNEKRVKTDTLDQGITHVVEDGQTGRSIKVTRRVIQEGKTIHQDTFVSNYPMRPKIVEEGTRPTTTTTLPTTPTTTPPTTASTTTTTTAP